MCQMGLPSAVASCQRTTSVGRSALGIVIWAQIVDLHDEFAVMLGSGFDADVYMRYDYSEPQQVSKGPSPAPCRTPNRPET